MVTTVLILSLFAMTSALVGMYFLGKARSNNRKQQGDVDVLKKQADIDADDVSVSDSYDELLS